MPRHRIRAFIGRGGDDGRAVLGLDREAALQPDLVVLQGGEHAALAPRIEEIQRNLAARHGAAFASVAPFRNDPACTGDGATPGVRFHPTDAGHSLYARAALDALQTRWPELFSPANPRP